MQGGIGLPAVGAPRCPEFDRADGPQYGAPESGLPRKSGSAMRLTS